MGKAINNYFNPGFVHSFFGWGWVDCEWNYMMRPIKHLQCNISLATKFITYTYIHYRWTFSCHNLFTIDYIILTYSYFDCKKIWLKIYLHFSITCLCTNGYHMPGWLRVKLWLWWIQVEQGWIKVFWILSTNEGWNDQFCWVFSKEMEIQKDKKWNEEKVWKFWFLTYSVNSFMVVVWLV